MLQPQFGRGDLADNVHMLVVLVLFVVDVTCLEGSGPRLRSAQVGLLDCGSGAFCVPAVCASTF